MPLVKVQKGKAYFKRFQTKYRRRREGKTDYYARKRLCANAKNKYASPKYRLVVRFTNTTVICQIVYAELKGDKTIASAYSSELPRYGLPCGLKNYAASYCTGLLCARRALTKLGLADIYAGNEEVTGEINSQSWGRRQCFVAELDDDKRPFRANLDVGTRRTTTGCKLFGVLKGASDGGIDVPHSYKRFPGYDPESKEYSAETHREFIFGESISSYMAHVQEQDEENGTDLYSTMFSKYVAAGIGPDDLEDLYAKVHAAIRADPSPKHATSAKSRHDSSKFDKKFRNPARLSYEARKARVQVKLDKRAAAAAAEEDDE